MDIRRIQASPKCGLGAVAPTIGTTRSHCAAPRRPGGRLSGALSAAGPVFRTSRGNGVGASKGCDTADVPTFCRHSRLLATCPICSKDEAPAQPARSPRPARSRGASTSRPREAPGLRVRRVERAPDDGYDHDLVPGLRSSVDAARLADELAFAAARLQELAEDPPGLYADVALAGDAEEAAWLAFLIAYLCPLRGPEAFASIEAARVPWHSGELSAVEGLELGPRTAHEPGRGETTLLAYRAWATRAGSQQAALAGDADWEAERRFARTFERLTLPGFGRGPRFELLVSLGALGVVPVAAGTLAVGGDATDPVVLAAKRVLGIGDAINLERRATELVRGTGVPLGALDLALFNWSVADDARATMGARRAADPERRAGIAAALRVA